MKRQERLQQSTQEKEQSQVSHQVAQDKLQAQADLLETQRMVSVKKQELDELKSAPTLSLSRIVQVQDELEGYEKGVKAIEALIKELF